MGRLVYHRVMANIVSISELGNQMVINVDDGRRLLAVPTVGGLWMLREQFQVGDAPVEPPPPPVTTPEPTPNPGGSAGGWQWPFQYSKYVIQNFQPAQYGMRVNPVSGVYRLHAGLDFGRGGISGLGIPAAADGTVIHAAAYGGEGNSVHIRHAGGEVTKYFHMVNGSFAVTKNQQVKRGQILGRVGSTGNSTGAHLHWETWPTPAGSQNPRDFMKAKGVPEN